MWPGKENPYPKPPGMSEAEYQRLFKQQRYPTAAEVRTTNERNPEAAAARGAWSDLDFLRTVNDRNDQMKDTQFADYHGHGWNFRAVYKRDREGNLLDAGGNMASYGTDTAHIVDPNDPEKFRKAGQPQFVKPAATPGPGQPGKAVHLMDIHTEVGMQCADCHFAQDSHGNGFIHGEVANSVEIGCKDCHGTADKYPTLRTSNLAAPPAGTDLSFIRNPDGRLRFEWSQDSAGRRVLVQRSASDPSLVWRVKLVKDSVTQGHPDFNAKAARAKLVGTLAATGGKMSFGPGVAARAHNDDNMACFSCHTSWTTSCGGCHLPIEANWKAKTNKYEEQETRNYATYNPQVARDEMFQLGRHQTSKGSIIAPIRSSSARRPSAVARRGSSERSGRPITLHRRRKASSVVTAITVQASAPLQRKTPCGTKSGWRLPQRFGALPVVDWAMRPEAASGNMHSTWLRSISWPRTSSGMRFHTRPGPERRSSSPSSPKRW
jgi:hypothetical protein